LSPGTPGRLLAGDEAPGEPLHVDPAGRGRCGHGTGWHVGAEREDPAPGAQGVADQVEAVEHEVRVGGQQHGVLVADRLALHRVGDDDRRRPPSRDGSHLERRREAGPAAAGQAGLLGQAQEGVEREAGQRVSGRR
jgi:hypothetical protein